MEIIKEALVTWGEPICVCMENRSLYYCSVLEKWRVVRGFGRSKKNVLYEGGSFMLAFECLLGTRAAEHPLQPTASGAPEYDTAHPDPMFAPRESRTDGGG